MLSLHGRKQLVYYLSLCILTLSLLCRTLTLAALTSSPVGSNQASANSLTLPQQQPLPPPRLTPSLVQNQESILSTAATFNIPPQSIATTSTASFTPPPAPPDHHHHNSHLAAIHQTMPPALIMTTPAPAPSTPQATQGTTPASSQPSSMSSMMIVSRPTTPTTTPTPFAPDRSMMIASTSDSFMLFTTSSPDLPMFKPNKSFDELTSVGNTNTDPFQQQPPSVVSQPSADNLSSNSDMPNFGSNDHHQHDSLMESQLDHRRENNFAQPMPDIQHEHQNTGSIINMNNNNSSVSSSILPQEQANTQSNNNSQTSQSHNSVPNFAPQQPDLSSAQNNPISTNNQNITSSSTIELREMRTRPQSQDQLPISAQIMPEGRSDDLAPSQQQPTPLHSDETSRANASLISSTPTTVTSINTLNNSSVGSLAASNERRHQILKPKSKFKCADPSDCHNGGICLKEICFCLPGFTGESCDVNIDECRQFGVQPCLNNGTCIDEINNFRCECPAGFRGERCQDLADMCADSPCLNNATCTNHVTSYTCNCEPGWDGPHCENNTNECASDPCQNGGTCLDLVNNYKCYCNQGFTGAYCEINVDDCDSHMCQNNGTCHDLVNDYECECRPGFAGKFCEKNIDECAHSSCLHGRCTDLINGYECKCNDGYTGKNCDTDIDECERAVCNNGGICVNTEGSFRCNCKEGFTGKCFCYSECVT